MSDLIRREDAIKTLHKHFSSGFDCDRWWNSTTVLFALNSVPSADRPQGEWVTIDTEIMSVPVYWNEEQRQSDERGAGILEKCECSVCGWRKNFMGYKKLGVNKSYNFCPNCGCRMKGVDHENVDVL